jgi:hypothetical protein
MGREISMKRGFIFGLALAASSAAFGQASQAGSATLVNPDNFNRAESDKYFAETIKRAGGVGKLDHRREIMDIKNQAVVRANRDTLYSAAVFDLDGGPVTITLPDAGKRFMSLMAIDEDQYVVTVEYGAGKYTFTKDQVGTRYLMIGIRTFVDPASSGDIKKVHDLQDHVEATQVQTGGFVARNWDQASQNKVRDALLVLSSTLPDTKRTYGSRSDTDPVRHLIGSAAGWGGNPEQDATYLTVTPPKNDGKTIYKLTVKDVPVDGFWSISMYNTKGYFEPNKYDAYTVNNLTAKRSVDGSVTVQFGGCDGKIPNCLPTPPNWTYWVRLYRPRQEVLDGKWTFPAPVEIQ